MIIESRTSTVSHTLQEIIDLLLHHEVDLSTLSSLAQQCGAAKDLLQGKRLHAYVIKRGLDKELDLGNRLLQMYVKCGSFSDVVDCFLSMHEKNELSWNFLITAHARDGHYEQAVCAFQRMQCEGSLPNEHILASTISACTSGAAIMNGKNIHAQVTESVAKSSVVVLNVLVDMYAKSNSLQDARRLFDQVVDRSVISWTIMISAYSQLGHGKEALFLYVQMCEEGMLPNRMTFASMLAACATHEWLLEGKRLHVCVVGCNLQSEVVLAISLVTMYGNCGSLEGAFEVFVCLKDRNTILWTAMISGCVKQEEPDRALQLYRRMLLEGGVPDGILYSSVLDSCKSQEALRVGKHVHAVLVTKGVPLDMGTTMSLLNMYGQNGFLKEAQSIFDKIKIQNTLFWTSIIASHIQHGNSKEAIKLFMQMQIDGVPPDKATFWRAIDACTDEAAINEGKWVHGLIVEDSLESNSALATALVSMYGRCKELREAQHIFENMQQKSQISWTMMITECTQCCANKQALLLYDQMQHEGVIPNRATCVCILSACAKESHIAKGKELHLFIANSGFCNEVVAMTALISMYGYCGHLEDARRVFDEMKERNVISWNAMLAGYTFCGCSVGALSIFEEMESEGIIPNRISFFRILDACASQANLSTGEIVHSFAVKCGYDHDVDVGNVILNMYGKCGRPKDAHRVFKQMPQSDCTSWNSMIGVWAQHGHVEAVFHLFQKMRCLPDKIVYVALLYICGHTGLVSEGVHYFTSLIRDHSVPLLTAEHGHCMIYMFARAGLMQEAKEFLEKLPIQPTSITWTSFFNAFKGHPGIDRGVYIVQHAMELKEEDASPYVMLSNFYAASKSGELYVSDSSPIYEAG